MLGRRARVRSSQPPVVRELLEQLRESRAHPQRHAFVVSAGQIWEATRLGDDQAAEPDHVRPASAWRPRLLAVFGAGLIGAGIFVADPMNGFPAGTPAGRPETLSVHGILHIVVAAIAFLCLVAACFVQARRFAKQRRAGWMVYSLITGVVFLLAFAGVASGSSSPIVVLGFWAGVIVAFGWIAAISIDLYRGALVTPKAA